MLEDSIATQAFGAHLCHRLAFASFFLIQKGGGVNDLVSQSLRGGLVEALWQQKNFIKKNPDPSVLPQQTICNTLRFQSTCKTGAKELAWGHIAEWAGNRCVRTSWP